MHKIGALGLQKRRKGGSVAHDAAVMHAVRGAVGIRFRRATVSTVRMQIGAAQRGQLARSASCR